MLRYNLLISTAKIVGMRLVFLMFLFCSSFIVSGQTILPLKERAKVIEAIQEDRLNNLLPQLMSKTNLDMWVIVTREYNEDPIITPLLHSTWQNDIRVILEEPGFWGENGFKYIHGRQTEFILVGDKKNYLGK